MKSTSAGLLKAAIACLLVLPYVLANLLGTDNIDIDIPLRDGLPVDWRQECTGSVYLETVIEGFDVTLVTDTRSLILCRQACDKFKRDGRTDGCNAFTYSTTTKECFLKLINETASLTPSAGDTSYTTCDVDFELTYDSNSTTNSTAPVPAGDNDLPCVAIQGPSGKDDTMCLDSNYFKLHAESYEAQRYKLIGKGPVSGFTCEGQADGHCYWKEVPSKAPETDKKSYPGGSAPAPGPQKSTKQGVGSTKCVIVYGKEYDEDTLCVTADFAKSQKKYIVSPDKYYDGYYCDRQDDGGCDWSWGKK